MLPGTVVVSTGWVVVIFSMMKLANQEAEGFVELNTFYGHPRLYMQRHMKYVWSLEPQGCTATLLFLCISFYRHAHTWV